ncbi:MAG: NYN domain-containing protein [Deltaproteobacteria bacterium]|nr:NYN domain-containing protein [Deltaproteobacteria bacterium]
MPKKRSKPASGRTSESSPQPRAIVFVDGQNLFHAVKKAFGYHYPNYDIFRLARAVCAQQGWAFQRVHFYTGVPDAADNVFWHRFWSDKLLAMNHQGVKVFSRSLRYQTKTLTLPDGTQQSLRVGQEKGIDIRIALDVVRAVRLRECDVVVIFSQDQDLSEVADEVRVFAREQKRWVKIASAFPFGPFAKKAAGSIRRIGSRSTKPPTMPVSTGGISGRIKHNRTEASVTLECVLTALSTRNLLGTRAPRLRGTP